MSYLYYFVRIYFLRAIIKNLFIIFVFSILLNKFLVVVFAQHFPSNELWKNFTPSNQEQAKAYLEAKQWNIPNNSCISNSTDIHYFYKENSLEYDKPPTEKYDQELNICVEPTGYSSYFNPSMNLLWRVCNAQECYFGSFLLQGDGACKVIYGYPENGSIPSKKICARIEPNEQFVSDIQSSKIFNTHKFCAHMSNSDLQHKEMEILQFWNSLNMYHVDQYFAMLQESNGNLKLLKKMFNDLSFPMNRNLFLYNHENQVLQNVFLNLVLLSKYRKFSDEGHLTYYYSPTPLGCHEIPNAPGSESQDLKDFTLYKVCGKNPFTNQLETSTLDKPCEKVYKGKNINSENLEHVNHDGIKNYLRVAKNVVIPKCEERFSVFCRSPRGYDNHQSGYFQCIEYLNIKPKMITVDYFSIIQNIALWDIDTNEIQLKCFAQKDVRDPGRIIYALKIGNSDDYLHVSKYLIDEIGVNHDQIPLCTDDPQAFICQEPWGVDIGFLSQYDLELSLYGEDPSSANLYTKTIQDLVDKGKKFSVVNQAYQFLNGIQYPNQVCVINTEKNAPAQDTLVGCEQRSLIKNFLLAEPTGVISDSEIRENYYNPKLQALFQTGDGVKNISKKLIKAQTVSNSSTDQDESFVNLFGRLYQIVITSQNYLKDHIEYLWSPFDKQVIHSQDQSSEVELVISHDKPTIRGIYLDKNGHVDPNINPLDASSPTDISYLKGLEYIDGKYFRGGEKICLKPLEEEYQCALYSANCVLGKNSEVIKHKNLIDRNLCIDIKQLECKFENEENDVFTLELNMFIPDPNNPVEVTTIKEQYVLERTLRNTTEVQTFVGEQMLLDTTYKLIHTDTQESKMLEDSDMQNYKDACSNDGNWDSVDIDSEDKITIDSLPGGTQKVHPVHFAQFACDVWELKNEGVYWCLLDDK